jgi:hypothetical protein
MLSPVIRFIIIILIFIITSLYVLSSVWELLYLYTINKN